MRLNKDLVVVILLLSVFAVGTLNFVGTVEAATWKKYESGMYYEKNPAKGYKNTESYITYTKGSNEIKMDCYVYKTKDNKKILDGTLYFTKVGKKIKFYTVQKGKKSKTETGTYQGTVKQFYKQVKKEMGIK